MRNRRGYLGSMLEPGPDYNEDLLNFRLEFLGPDARKRWAREYLKRGPLSGAFQELMQVHESGHHGGREDGRGHSRRDAERNSVSEHPGPTGPLFPLESSE